MSLHASVRGSAGEHACRYLRLRELKSEKQEDEKLDVKRDKQLSELAMKADCEFRIILLIQVIADLRHQRVPVLNDAKHDECVAETMAQCRPRIQSD